MAHIVWCDQNLLLFKKIIAFCSIDLLFASIQIEHCFFKMKKNSDFFTVIFLYVLTEKSLVLETFGHETTESKTNI